MRIQIDLTEDKLQELKDLMKTVGVDTYKDLINSAVTLLRWTVGEVQLGRTIASVDEPANKYRELVMPVLEHAAHDAKKKKSQEFQAVG